MGFLDNTDTQNNGFLDNTSTGTSTGGSVEQPSSKTPPIPKIPPIKTETKSKGTFLSGIQNIGKGVQLGLGSMFGIIDWTKVTSLMEGIDTARRSDLDQLDQQFAQGQMKESDYLGKRSELVMEYDSPPPELIGKAVGIYAQLGLWGKEAQIANSLSSKFLGLSQVAKHLNKLSIIPTYTIQGGMNLGLFRAIDDFPRLMQGNTTGKDYAKGVGIATVAGSLIGFTGGAIQKVAGHDWIIKVNPKKLWKIQQKLNTTAKERELIGYVDDFSRKTGIPETKLYSKTGKSFTIDLRTLYESNVQKFLSETTPSNQEEQAAKKLLHDNKIVTDEVTDLETLNSRVADLAKKPTLTHFGVANLKQTDPKYFGTGYPSDRARDLKNYPKLFTKGTDFYKPNSTLEQGVVKGSKQQYMTKIQGTTLESSSKKYTDLVQEVKADPGFAKWYNTNDATAVRLGVEKLALEKGYSAIDYPGGVYAMTKQNVVPVKPFIPTTKSLKGPGMTYNKDGSMAEGLDHVVGIKGISIPIKDFSSKVLKKFGTAHKALLEQYPQLKIGRFTDKGKVDLDLSLNTDIETATKIGKITNQKSIYNAQTGETIELGGTGESPVQSPQDVIDIMDTVVPGKGAPVEAYQPFTNIIAKDPSIQVKMQLNRYKYKPYHSTNDLDIAYRKGPIKSAMANIENKINSAKLATVKPYDFLEQLDAGYPGKPFMTHVGRELQDAQRIETTLKRDGQKIWAQVGKDNAPFYSPKTIDIGGRKLAKNEIAVVAIQAENKYGLHKLINNNNFTENQIQKSKDLAKADPDIMKAVTQWTELAKKTYPPLAAEYLNQTGGVLGEEEAYLMMLGESGYGSATGEGDLSFFESELNKGALDLTKQSRAQINKSVLMQRAMKSKAPLLLDMERVVQKYIGSTSKYIASAPKLHKLRRLVNKIKPDITQKLGAPVSARLSEIIDDVLINPPLDITATKGAWNFAKSSLYKIGLGHNPIKTGLKQAASYANIYGYVTPKNVLKATTDIMSDFPVHYKDYMDNAEASSRFMSPEMQVAQSVAKPGKKLPRKVMDAIVDTWLSPIRLNDKPAAMIARLSAMYDHLEKVPGDFAGAEAHGIEVLNKTQPSSRIDQRNALQSRGGPIGQTLSFFQTQPKNIYNNIQTEYTKWRNGNIGTDAMAKHVFNQFALPTLQIALTNATFDAAAWYAWKKRDRAKAMVEYMKKELPKQMLGGMYLIGNILNNTTYGKGVVELPLNLVYEYGTDPFKVLASSEKDQIDLIESLAKSSVLATGLNIDLPRQQIKNAIRAVKGYDVSLGEWITGGEKLRKLQGTRETRPRKRRVIKQKWENRF